MGVIQKARERVSDAYLRAAVSLRHPSTIGWFGLEKLVKMATPVATVCTVGANPESSVPARAILGPFQVAKTGYDVVHGFAVNQGVRDFTGGVMGDMVEVGSHAAVNLYENPGKTALAAGITYALGWTVGKVLELKRSSKVDGYLAERR